MIYEHLKVDDLSCGYYNSVDYCLLFKSDGELINYKRQSDIFVI